MRAANDHPRPHAKSGKESDLEYKVSTTQPVIAGTSASDGVIRLDLYIPRDLCYFEGHFAGCSLLPGVVQINWAIQFGRQHFSLPARFSYLSQVKFMRVITPGSPATLALEFAATRGELAFTYHVVDALCSSGKIGFV